MKLSEIVSENTEIIQEGKFTSLGTFFSHFSSQIVYVVREMDIRKLLDNPSITCVITTPDLAGMFPKTMGILLAQSPRDTFYSFQSAVYDNPDFSLQPFKNRISPSAKIHPSAVIADSSVCIERNVVIEKNVVVNEQTMIEEGSIIRPNTILGSVPSNGNMLMGSNSARLSGGVYLHRDVDIHANTRIDRALFKGYTEIGEQTKIDNLDSIGSGTIIGKRCLICAGVSIGEAVALGDDIWIGPNVHIEDQLKIGNRTYITLGSTVTQDIGDNKVVKDNFAIDRKRFRGMIRGM